MHIVSIISSFLICTSVVVVMVAVAMTTIMAICMMYYCH